MRRIHGMTGIACAACPDWRVTMRVAFVDDREEDLRILQGHADRYRRERNEALSACSFLSSVEFLERYHCEFDVIFLDIEMPGEDGLNVAREIRKRDASVAILFVTNMIQYATCGYEVDAVDFIVKPIEYFVFCVKLEKAENRIRKRSGQMALIGTGGERRRLSVQDILYVEKDKNHLVYHTAAGEFRERGSMADLKQRLGAMHFSECMSGYLVNLEHIELIYKDSVYVGSAEIPISRRMKKIFIQDYMKYVGD